MTERRIYLAVPHYGQVEPETMLAVAEASRLKGVLLSSRSCSLLARNFNEMWCEALNVRAELGLTHFVMLHADIAPEKDWLPRLLDELDESEADILSAVSPIKDLRGLTSTAVRRSRDVTNLTQDDLAKLPATFDLEDARIIHPDADVLCINTGLMAVRFSEPWVERVHFECIDRIEQNPQTGRFETRGLSEDWYLSIQATQLGRCVCCTQKIGLRHFGRLGFHQPAFKPHCSEAAV